MSALDVVNAISLQNLILPTEPQKIGSRNTMFLSQCSAADDCGLEPNPDQDDWQHHYLHQRCAWVRDGFPPQTNIVRVNGSARYC